MQKQTPARFQYSVNLYDSQRHANQICKKAVLTKHAMQALDHFNRPRLKAPGGVLEKFPITFYGAVIPCPRVDKRLCLRAILATDVIVNLVIISLRVKRRIDVTQIDGFRVDILAQTI